MIIFVLSLQKCYILQLKRKISSVLARAKTIVMHDIYQRTLTGAFLTGLVILIVCCMPPWVFAFLMAILLGIILTTEWPRLLDYKKAPFWLIMPLYPIMPFIMVISMQLTGYHDLNKLIIAIVALYDTSSYLIGSLIGTHKINAFISPGKTWEGCIGGTLLTTLIVFSYFYNHTNTTLLLPLIPLTIGMCVCALLGDLFESMLKRQAGVKDSGTLLPGHGGLLDRVDGMMFVAVIGYCFRNYFLWLLLTFHTIPVLR